MHFRDVTVMILETSEVEIIMDDSFIIYMVCFRSITSQHYMSEKISWVIQKQGKLAVYSEIISGVITNAIN